ncbi:MAG: tetratricopeptide repeat protein [Melioribacteraceae bacterium]|nr:tetratricopeptide repeat protein [Melioribacteraceae bacterium]
MNIKLSNRNKLNAAFIVLLFFVSSCGVWSNFTTYFNRFYNATELYDEGFQTLMESKEELFQFRFEKTPKKADENFEKVIEKCSKILQYDSESSYFDDALFLTGKSLYYQTNYLKAERKFQELFSRNDEDLVLMAELWIGKTNLQLRDFEKGLEELEDVKEKAILLDEEEIAVDALSSQISYYVYREDFEESVKKCEELIEVSSSEELNAEVTYEIGKMYKELKKTEKAAAAFAKVNDYSPTFEIEFNSKIEVARLKRELEQNEESQRILDELYDEDKYVDFLDQIELEIGMNFYDLKDYEKAIDKFTIVDTTYKTSESTGIAIFMKAKILEDVLRDYDSSQVFYSKVLKTKAPEEYVYEARTKDKLLTEYLKIRHELDDQLTQFLYSRDSMAYVQDSIDYEEWKYQDSIKNAEFTKTTSQGVDDVSGESRTSGTRGGANTTTTRASSTKKKMLPPKYPVLSSDSLHTLCTKLKFEMGNLFFAELNVIDSAKYYYDAVIREYPDSLYTASQLFSLGSFYSSIENKQLSDSLFTIVYEKYTGQEVANEAAKKLGLEVVYKESNPVADSFYVAEKEMLDSNFTSAILRLYRIAKEHPESDYAPKALYTVGWILENDLELPDSASVVYDSLTVKYGTTKYAKEASPKLKEFKVWKREIVAKEKAIQDSIKMANMPPDSLKKTTIPEVFDSVGVVSDSLKTDEFGEGDSTAVAPIKEVTDSTQKKQIIKEEEISEAEQMFQNAIKKQNEELKKEEPKKEEPKKEEPQIEK